MLGGTSIIVGVILFAFALSITLVSPISLVLATVTGGTSLLLTAGGAWLLSKRMGLHRRLT